MTVALPFPGQTVKRVIFDHSVSLGGDGEGFLQIEQECEVSVDAVRAVVDPERTGQYAPLFVALLHRTVAAATADDTGALRVSFSGGASLSVQPVDAHEAWTFSGAGGVLVVCLPGGGLTTWGAVGQ